MKTVQAPIFVTERLVVRPWMVEDASIVLDMFGREEVAKWTSTPEPITELGQAVERIERWSAPLDGHPSLGSWAIVPSDGGSPIGLILLRPLADSEEIEVGWTLHPAATGNGYATEAARGAIDHAFAHGYATVRAIMWPENRPSAAVSERIGMQRLGIKPDRWHGDESDPCSLMYLITDAGGGSA